MKVRSNIHAGNALRDCQRQRDYWKSQAARMELLVNTPAPNPQPQPLPQPQPTQPTPGGGWVGSTFYYDRSGWCG